MYILKEQVNTGIKRVERIKRNICFILTFIFLNLRKLIYSLKFLVGKVFIKKKILFKFPDKSIKKILIFRTDRIGDLVLTTPAISTLKKNYPKAQIDIVIQKYTAPVLENNPDVDNIIFIDNYSEKKLIEKLKKENYDMAVIFYSITRDKRIAYKSKIPIRVGSNRDGGGFYLTHCIKDTRAKLRHEVEACLDILSPLNLKKLDKKLRIFPDDKYKKRVNKLLGKYKIKPEEFIVIHPFSRDPLMRWPEIYYIKLTQMLSEKLKERFKIVIIGSKKEVGEARRFLRYLKKNKKIVNLAGKFSLGELIYFLNLSSLFIGNSTGPMHIANALGTPVIVFYGSHYERHHYKRWYPWNRKKSIEFVAPQICKLCYPWCCKLECFYMIKPEEVFEKIRKRFKSFFI